MLTDFYAQNIEDAFMQGGVVDGRAEYSQLPRWEPFKEVSQARAGLMQTRKTFLSLFTIRPNLNNRQQRLIVSLV
jgi:hypothetical protein